MRIATSLLSVALVATSTWAAPLVGRQDDIQLYQLQVSSPGHDTLDGQYLMTNGTTLGFLLSAEPPLQVYTTESSKDGLMEIHTYPIGIVNHALGLHGPKGLMNLVDMVNPQGEKDDDVVQVWDTFRMADDGELLNDGGGQWYTFPVRRGGYIVKWYDGSLGITDDYLPVKISMTEVGKGQYNDIEN